MISSHLDRRSKYSQAAIQEAFLKILDDKPLDSITVTEVCNVADVNRGTFYKYYKDVPDLFLQIKGSFFAEIKKTMEVNQVFNVENIFSEALKAIQGNKNLLRVMQKSGYTQSAVDEVTFLLKDTIINGIKASKPYASDIEIECVFQYIIGAGANLISQWICNNMELPIDEVQKVMVNATVAVLNSI